VGIETVAAIRSLTECSTIIDPENEDELAAAICAALSTSRTETHDYTRFGICAFATHLQSILEVRLHVLNPAPFPEF
jgi:hypothetical protein